MEVKIKIETREYTIHSKQESKCDFLFLRKMPLNFVEMLCTFDTLIFKMKERNGDIYENKGNGSFPLSLSFI